MWTTDGLRKFQQKNEPGETGYFCVRFQKNCFMRENQFKIFLFIRNGIITMIPLFLAFIAVNLINIFTVNKYLESSKNIVFSVFSFLFGLPWTIFSVGNFNTNSQTVYEWLALLSLALPVFINCLILAKFISLKRSMIVSSILSTGLIIITLIFAS